MMTKCRKQEGTRECSKKRGEENDRNKKGHQNVWPVKRNKVMLQIRGISRSLKVNQNCVVVERKRHETTVTSTLNQENC